MQKVNKFFDVIESVCKALLVILFATIIIAAFLQVFSRFVIGKAFTWTDELSRYGLVWLVFIAAGLGVRRKTHVCIDVVYNKFPAKMQSVVSVIHMLLIMAMASVMIVKGLALVQTGMVQRSPALSLPMGLVYLAVPLSGALMFLFAANRLICNDAGNDSAE